MRKQNTSNISHSRISDHTNLIKTVQNLSNILCKHDEEPVSTNDEKFHMNEIANQINSLKRCLLELADSIVDEMDTFKYDLRSEIKLVREEWFDKLDHTIKSNRDAEETYHQLNSALTQTTKQAFQQIQTLKAKQEESFLDMDQLKNAFSDLQMDQNEYFTQVQKLIDTNSMQISIVFKEHKDMINIFQRLKKENIPEYHGNEKDPGDMRQIAERLSYEIREIQREILSIKKTDEKAETNDRIDEIMKTMNEEFVKLKNDLESKSDNIQRDMLKTTEEYMKALREISQEPLRNRVEFLEEMTTTQRRELFLSITTAEQNLTKKHEKVLRAIYQISRHIQLPETTLGI